MRQIGTLSNENQASRFSNYLKSIGIGSSFDGSFDATNGYMSYHIWVQDEDRLQEATHIFEEFQKNPSHPKFDAPIQEESISEEPQTKTPTYRYRTHLTTFFLSLCAMIFFLNTLEEVPMLAEGISEESFAMTPLQATFMYDLPPAFEELERTIQKYEGKKYTEIPPEVKTDLEATSKSPYWHGIYDWIVTRAKGKDPSSITGPLFVRIRQGEFWRLFTPCILHSNFLHILFNMLWLWYLGRPIEQRIGPLRTLLLTLLTGIGSNTIQYFMSGPFFIGYSGIITGLAGFTWMRERIAPWEGYPLNRPTILFLFLFILSILVLSLATFFIQIFTSYQFEPNIANTAHIAGAVIGALLARSHFFAQRVQK